MTTIERLYYGQIRPHEKIVDPESRFAVLRDLLFFGDEDLLWLLPENCKGTYDAFKAAYESHFLSDILASFLTLIQNHRIDNKSYVDPRKMKYLFNTLIKSEKPQRSSPCGFCADFATLLEKIFF